MLIPKASHLVERVAERLLKTGALDGSAAQLLQPGAAAAADGSAKRPVEPPVATPDPVERRSSLFVAPPAIPMAQPMTLPAMPEPVAPPKASWPDQTEAALPAEASGPALAAADSAVLDAAPPRRVLPDLALPSAVPGNTALGSGGTGTPLSGTPLAAPAFTRAPTADPAAGPLQGPSTIDAVALERAGMVDWSRTRTRISEEFRLVQRQIIRSAFGPGAEPGFSNLLLVTSARPGEGKSFMSTNLAGSIARQGDNHVLLVDADSKRDSICYSLGLAQSRGLLDLAANPKLDPAPLIVKTPIERLSILPVGRERERSAELFSTKEMTRLIQSLGRRYADRLLILDAPPCLSTSDPAVLAQVVGQILFVVEADRTQRDEIEASLDLIQACPSITMVLNKQQISSRYTFGAYSSYYSS